MSAETRRIWPSQEAWLEDALRVLRGGGLAAFPTDTVYGLGGLATDSAAIDAIFRAKDRPGEKSIPVLVAGWAEVDQVAVLVPRAERLAAAFWPGALTIVMPRRPSLPAMIGPEGTVGVRAPDHPVAQALLSAAGPLATSSANRSGEPSPRTAADVMRSLEGRIELVIDGGQAPGGRPSTVVDCTGDRPVLLRVGPITLEDILAEW